MLPARPLRKSELVTLSQSYSCAGIYIPTSKLHINLKAKQSSLIFQHQRTERRGDLPETTTLIAAHLESGPRPPWLQGPCAFCSATLPSTGPLTHISVSPHTEVELFMPSGLEDFIRICWEKKKKCEFPISLAVFFRLLFIFIFEGEKNKTPGKEGWFRGGHSHPSCRHSVHLNSSENINWLLNRPWLIRGVQKPNCLMGSTSAHGARISGRAWGPGAAAEGGSRPHALSWLPVPHG